jgi:hypothetical protein
VKWLKRIASIYIIKINWRCSQMKKNFGIILTSAGLLVGCGTNTISENAKSVNEYTQSDIGTKLEKVGCELSTNKQDGKHIELTVNNCSTISNNDVHKRKFSK